MIRRISPWPKPPIICVTEKGGIFVAFLSSANESEYRRLRKLRGQVSSPAHFLGRTVTSVAGGGFQHQGVDAEVLPHPGVIAGQDETGGSARSAVGVARPDRSEEHKS